MKQLTASDINTIQMALRARIDKLIKDEMPEEAKLARELQKRIIELEPKDVIEIA